VTQPNSLFSISTNQSDFDIPTQSIGGGNIRLKFEATYSDGSKRSRYKEFLVLAAEKPKAYDLTVVRKYPHDPTSFTQGFLIYNNYLYEGTGTIGESRLRKMDLASGEVLQQQENEKEIFGEGITIFNDKIYQLTYKSGRAFIYDLNTFEPIEEYSFRSHTGEGWGLTNNDTALIASDGSAFLYFLSPNDFSEMKRLTVFDNQGEVENLNELEYYNGKIYANLYTTAQLVAIDPNSGQVTDTYLARGIVTQDDVTDNMDVLNGVTFNPGTGNMLITGKYWSKIYEVTPVAAKN
jgi:glutamine cyclotransferase